MNYRQKIFSAVNLSLGIFLSTCNLQAQQRIELASYGVRPNSFENASAGIRKAIEENKERPGIILVLPGGRIDVWPEHAFKEELYISNTTESDSLSKVKNIAFLLKGVINFTIEGNNTLVILHGKMISYAIINSKNITIKNLQFDYERPTMSELTINSISDTAADVMIHPDSRYFINNGRIGFYGEGWKANSYHAIVFDNLQKTMRYSSFKAFDQSVVQEIQPGRLRFSGDFSKRNFQAGNTLTVRDPYRDNCGAFIWLSKNILLENIKMHYMHGLGIVSQFSENIRFYKVQVKPRENSGRVISAFADCFHFSGCKGSIELDSCQTSGSHDDPVNVHGTHLKITAVKTGGKMTVRFMHHQTYGFEAFFKGDSIAFVNPQTLHPVGFAQIKTAILVNKKEMELEVEDWTKDIPVGTVIENLTWTPAVTITNCHFERTNARGLLLTTRKKVLIENNTFSRIGMHAILIADDAASWFESGPVQDVTIRNNRFEECGYVVSPDSYVIAVAPENHFPVTGYYVHRNITIENNIFRLFDAPLLTAKSVDGLIFTGNSIVQEALPGASFTKNAFILEQCKNVVIRKNTFSVSWQPFIQVSEMLHRYIKTDLKYLQVK